MAQQVGLDPVESRKILLKRYPDPSYGDPVGRWRA